MVRIPLLLFLLGFCGWGSFVQGSSLQKVTVSFYSENLSVIYNPDLLQPQMSRMEEKQMVDYYFKLKKTHYQILLQDLEQKKEQLQLNDWLYYELMKKTVQQIFARKSPQEVELCCWFLLSQAGFDTRLTYLDQDVFIYVFSEDEVFEVPMIEDEGRSFINLTSIHYGMKSQPALYLLNFKANANGKAFSFYLDQLPKLSARPRNKALRFNYLGEHHILEVQVDLTIAKLMESYPFISEQQYLEVPLSSTVAQSLLPQLKLLLNGKSAKEAIEILVSFTRSSFQYKEDKEHFGKSKPMIADEVFHYTYSDCEDRSALFYCLVKELLDLPMVIIAYPDHLTIGVALSKITGDSVRYQGKDYFICDPTGPVDSAEIGEVPYGYENTPFKIIGNYK